MFEAEAERLADGMDDVQRKMLVENSTTLGRRWLDTIPYFQPLRLSDYDVSTGIHARTLVPGHSKVCNLCGNANKLGHDEICMGRNR